MVQVVTLSPIPGIDFFFRICLCPKFIVAASWRRGGSRENSLERSHIVSCTQVSLGHVGNCVAST